MYELRTAELGEEQDQTIIAGKNYAIDLHNANRGDDARELLMKLQATSKRVRGSEHNITKEVALALEELEVADHGWWPLSRFSPICRFGLLWVLQFGVRRVTIVG